MLRQHKNRREEDKQVLQIPLKCREHELRKGSPGPQPVRQGGGFTSDAFSGFLPDSRQGVGEERNQKFSSSHLPPFCLLPTAKVVSSTREISQASPVLAEAPSTICSAPTANATTLGCSQRRAGALVPAQRRGCVNEPGGLLAQRGWGAGAGLLLPRCDEPVR